MEATFDDFYLRLRGKTHAWIEKKGPRYRHAEALLVAPDLFHLLGRLLFDPRVPAADKLRLGAAVAYFVLPADLLPELTLGPGGFLDDVAVAAGVLSSLLRSGQGEVAREHWAGQKDLLEVVQGLLAVGESGVVGRVARGFRKLRALRL